MSVDLMAAVAGPYTTADAAPTLPRLPVQPAPAPVPAPMRQPQAAPESVHAPTPVAAAPEPVPQIAPAVWWSVVHRSGDASERHVYCGACHARIPEFLVREATILEEGAVAAARCEGCGTGPDLTADTVEVLTSFIGLVESTDRYPTKDGLGDEATIACLEHARECVMLCAAARGTLNA